MMTANAFPLHWPETFPRSAKKDAGKFKTTMAGALKNVQDSLRLFASDSGKKLDNLVISSNVTLGSYNPVDAGVAVWFVWDGLQVCIAVDRYSKVEANLQAIHHIIEARRVELRHGTLALVRATFQGFKALPSPAKESWYKTLNIPTGATVTRDVIERQYREQAKKDHPDAGGSQEAMARLNAAREAALKEIA